jgi:hypothetical protein
MFCIQFSRQVCRRGNATLVNCHVSNHGGGGAGIVIEPSSAVQLVNVRVVPGSGCAVLVTGGSVVMIRCDVRSPCASGVVVEDGGSAYLLETSIRDVAGAGVRLLSR